jgi:hypothetical protein
MSPKKHGIRNAERIPVSIETELVSEGIKYPGYIKNISGNGINTVVYSTKSLASFIPGAMVEISFQPLKAMIKLQCEVSWVQINKNPSYGLIYNIALEIKDQPPEYKTFLTTSR